MDGKHQEIFFLENFINDWKYTSLLHKIIANIKTFKDSLDNMKEVFNSEENDEKLLDNYVNI